MHPVFGIRGEMPSLHKKAHFVTCGLHKNKLGQVV
jgi:hypothetical protein